MSFDNLVNDKIDDIRYRLGRGLTEVCHLSRKHRAEGIGRYFDPQRRRRTTRAEVFLDGPILYVWDAEYGQREFISLEPEIILHLKGLKWRPVEPFHPLEALGNTAMEGTDY